MGGVGGASKMKMQDFQVSNTVEAEKIERQLADLWNLAAGTSALSEEQALLRARAANLVIYLSNDTRLLEFSEDVNEIAEVHPCRALLIIADKEGPDRDIEILLSACQDRRTINICCEQIVFTAHGRFVPELPSVVLPLFISDLPVFLCSDVLPTADPTFKKLTEQVDRLIIDSAEFLSANNEWQWLERSFAVGEVAISDFNWARLTPWRSALANFYDVAEYRAVLNHVARIRIDYSAPETDTRLPNEALLIAGWLVSRLHCTPVSEPGKDKSRQMNRSFSTSDGRQLQVQINPVAGPPTGPGGLIRVELTSNNPDASFIVERSEDLTHINTRTIVDRQSKPGRVLPIRSRTITELLSREMELLRRDPVYEEAVVSAATMADQMSRDL